MAIKRALIVDDEPLARELLQGYLQKLPGFEIAGSCANAVEAFAVLSSQPVDLLLLDINMPGLSGIDFLKTLKHPPKVIFTTAYDSYAVESYALHAVDYLLKPITFDRFMQALHKLEESPAAPAAESVADNMLFVKSEGKMVRVNPEEIWFIEGYGNYVRLWSANGKLVLHSTMKNMEEWAQRQPMFLRIGKSYIINLRFVTEIDGNAVQVATESLAIGSTYREDVKRTFERFQLL